MTKKKEQRFKIPNCDTLEIFKNLDEKTKKNIWFDHHTKLGNQMICDFVSKKL